MASHTFYRRTFLNARGHHAGAYILAGVHPEKYSSCGHPMHDISAWITVADCARVATFDFDVHMPGDAENALHKAHLLRSVVNDFTEALERAVADRDTAGTVKAIGSSE